MFDIKNPSTFKLTPLLTSYGDLTEIIGSNAKEPEWSNISNIGFGSKYTGTEQSLSIPYSIDSVTLPTLIETELKDSDSITYWIHKELLQLIVHSTLPYNVAVNLPLSTDLFRTDNKCMSGIFWSNYKSGTVVTDSISYLRKKYIKYTGNSQTTYCALNFKNYTANNYVSKSTVESIKSIPIYYINELPNAFGLFTKQLAGYGSWKIDKVFPKANEYCITDYKILNPSAKFKELRKNTDRYKNYVKQNGSDKNFEFTYNSAIDILQSLGATFADRSTVTNKITSGGKVLYEHTAEGSVTTNENPSNSIVTSDYMSKTTPIVTKAVCSSENEEGHIFNYMDFMNSDVHIVVNYDQTKVLNGNLLANVNIPSSGQSSAILIEQYTPPEFKNRNKHKFIRNDAFIAELMECDKKSYNAFASVLWFGTSDLKNEVKRLHTKYNNDYTKDMIDYLNGLQSVGIGPIQWTGDNRCFIFRFTVLCYMADYFDSITNNPVKLVSRTYPNSKLYEPQDNPLLTQYCDMPSIRWISDNTVKAAKIALQQTIIPGLINKWIELLKTNTETQKQYILDKYKNESENKFNTFNNIVEYPIITLIGTNSRDTFTTFDGINRINSDNASESNSIFQFNYELSSCWNIWCNTLHMQIKVPTYNKCLEVFYSNSALISLSFPTSPQTISPNGIQIVDKNSNQYIKQDGNFELLTEYEIQSITGTGVTSNTVQLYVPKYLVNRVKIISNTINGKQCDCLVIAFYPETLAIPSVLLNAIF